MCIEEPWTDPEAWRLVDLRTNDGRVYSIFFDLMLKMGGDEKNLKEFAESLEGQYLLEKCGILGKTPSEVLQLPEIESRFFDYAINEKYRDKSKKQG